MSGSFDTDESTDIVDDRIKIEGATDDTPISNTGSRLDVDASISSIDPSAVKDFFLEVAKGNVPGHSAVSKFGFNERVGNSAFEDVWDGSTIYTFPTTAQTVNVKSTSTADTSAGTGARTVLIQGLDTNYDEIEETITLNGTTNVLSTNSYLRLFRMKVITAGSGEFNAGDITATNTTDSDLLAQISVGVNQTLMAIYTVPAGKTAYLLDWDFSLDAKMSLLMLVRKHGEVFQTKRKVFITVSGKQTWTPYFKITEKSDIRVEAQSETGNNEVGSSFNLILVDN